MAGAVQGYGVSFQLTRSCKELFPGTYVLACRIGRETGCGQTVLD
jgi:hypothetical protein